MRKYQLFKTDNDYAISDFDTCKIDFATTKNFSDNFKKCDVLETESPQKPAFIAHIHKFITQFGIHPIFNSKGETCEQIVNIPERVMSSDEILNYLNRYTILQQETPPWEEIIYRLNCFSSVLTEEYYDKMNTFSGSEEDLISILSRPDEDIDTHYFVTAPKISEDKRGSIFMFLTPTKPNRKWVKLDEYYDYKRNAWVTPGLNFATKRVSDRIDLVDKKKPLTQYEITKAKRDFISSGGSIKKEITEKKVVSWQDTEVHELALMIPIMAESDRGRLKEDIQINGLKESLWLFEGKILEGRTRFGICLELGIKPKFKPFQGPGSPLAFVLSMNLHRRHLNSSQIAAIGVDQYLEKFENEAKNRQVLNGSNRSKKMNIEFIPYSKKGTACEHVASFLKTNSRYILDAKSIKESSPKLFDKILLGDMTITRAKRIIRETTPKKTTSKKFETRYKSLLKILITRSKDPISKDPTIALKSLSAIYLRWNKRNDKLVMKRLDDFKVEFSDILEKKERHLRLLEM